MKTEKIHCQISPCVNEKHRTITFSPSNRITFEAEAQTDSLKHIIRELGQVLQMISHDASDRVTKGIESANEIVSNSEIIGKIVNMTYQPIIKSVNIVKIIISLVEIFPTNSNILINTVSDRYIFECLNVYMCC